MNGKTMGKMFSMPMRSAIAKIGVPALAWRRDDAESKCFRGANTLVTTTEKDAMIVPVILCGGSGTRLWPLSRGLTLSNCLTS